MYLIAFLILVGAFVERSTLYWILAFLACCKIVTLALRGRLELHYSKKNKLFSEFVQKSRITQMVFEPFLLAPTAGLQGPIYLICEELNNYFNPQKFDRETFQLEDGGTVGIDWVDGVPDANQRPDKPILIVCPGLGGGSHNLYCLQLIWRAQAAGYKVGSVLFRGAEGLPITSGKLSYSGCWQDCEALIEYVRRKYVDDPKTGKARTRLYAYGCSLGAQILGLYLGQRGERSSKVLDGAVLYATPWSIEKGYKHFYENFFGLYQYIIGINLNNQIKKKQMPLLKKHLSEEDSKHYEWAFESNRTGLDHIDEHVYCRMFGHKDRIDYYRSVSLDRFINDIKVPTFAFGAADDQLCGHQFIPFGDIVERDESQVFLASSRYGGHATHMEGLVRPTPWYQVPCIEYLNFLEGKLARSN